MARCEDYPCCGHEAGDCPDPNRDTSEFWPLDCVECGGAIKRGDECYNAPSLHQSCADRYSRMIEEYGYDPHEDEYA